MLQERAKLYQRKRGSVVRLTAEIDMVQYNRFTRIIEVMGMSKKQAVQTAIDFWLNSLPKEARGE